MAYMGQIIDGNFRILRYIGTGGMSRVYLAQDERLAKLWVIKEIPKIRNGGDNRLFIQSALKEADIIKGLDHPAIVRIVDIAEDARALYIVEDYISGVSLRRLAKQHPLFTETQLLDWALQTAGILSYLHSRKPPVIYRDLKPDNLILSDSGHIRMIDFGIARRYHPGKSRDTVYLGTERFAAPEQYAEYGAQTDMRTDIYGFGKTMLFLMEHSDKLSSGFHAVIRKCVEHSPEHRYQNAEELLAALRNLTAGRRRRLALHVPCRRNPDPDNKGRRKQVPGSGVRHRQIPSPVLLRRIILPVLAAAVLLLAVCSASVPRNNPGNEISGLLAMTAEYRSDGLFSEAEEELLLNRIMPDLSELKEQEGFKELVYNIGILYREYYGYGAGQSIGAEESASWFEMAGDYDITAPLFAAMGQLRAELRKLADSGATDASPDKCLTLLQDLASLPEDGSLDPEIRLEVCSLIINTLESYGRKLFNAGISGPSLRSLYESTAQQLAAIPAVTAQDATEKNLLMSRLDSADTLLRQIIPEYTGA